MMKQSRLLILMLCLLLLLGSCADQLEESTEPPRSVAIPQPTDLAQITEPRLLQAIENAREAIRQNPQSATAWGNLGNVYLIHDWPSEAAQCYEHAIAIAPTKSRWFYHLGRSLEETDVAAAGEAFSQALVLDPEYPPTHLYYAYSLMKLGRAEEAQQHLKRTAELDPKNPFALLRLGELELAARRFESARAFLQEALALNPEQSEAHLALAQLSMALGDREAAQQHAEAARHPTEHASMRDPLWGEVQLAGATSKWVALRGQFYLDSGDYQRAVTELAQIAHEREDPAFWLSYGTALLFVKRSQEAAVALGKALGYADNNNNSSDVISEDMEKIYINLGLAYLNLARTVEAKKYLQEALTVNPNSIDALNKLAFLYYQQGKLPETIEILQRSRRVGPDSQTLRLLAAVLRDAGDLTTARAVEEELRRLEQR